MATPQPRSEVGHQCATKEGSNLFCALTKADDWLRAVLNTSVDAIVMINRLGIIVVTNPAAERLFGYAQSEMIGQNVSMLMPPPYREEHDQYLGNYLRTGVKRIIGIGREVVAQRKDGSIFPIELAVSTFGHVSEPMFTGIIRDISQRRAMEREVLEVRTAEQRRFAQELHDGVGSQLTGIGLLARSLELALEREHSALSPAAGDLLQHIRDAHQAVRSLSHGMSQNVAPDGLVAALRDLIVSTEQKSGIPCRLEGDGALEVHYPVVAVHLYRIAQEAVTNAVQHGKPTEIRISLMRDGECNILSIHDNGCGFQQSPDSGDGIGLRTMTQRAHLIGANLDIKSSSCCGTTVTCTFRSEVANERRSTADHEGDTHPDRGRPSHRAPGPEATPQP